MSNETHKFKEPVVITNGITQIAEGVWVIPDSNHTPLVPNIGIIVGTRASLIIDTGFGPENARTVLREARRLSADKPIFLTHTHCHPEHGFGANVISEDVTVLYNETQWDELNEKGPCLLQMFKQQIPPVAPMLEGVEFLRPELLYTGSFKLDLGGNCVVEFREFGGGHSRGDQAILVNSSSKILFTGDLVEEGTFGVLGDNESNATVWIDRLKGLELLNPDIVVPGHGFTGGTELITNYRTYFEFVKKRVNHLRTVENLKEAEIIEKVNGEVIALHPDWGNQIWARKTVANFSWPARM